MGGNNLSVAKEINHQSWVASATEMQNVDEQQRLTYDSGVVIRRSFAFRVSWF
jgi:hypothetical protein